MPKWRGGAGGSRKKQSTAQASRAFPQAIRAAGQWTDGNGSPASKPQGINDPRVISDADPENIKPGEQYAQAGGRRGAGTILINGRRLEISPRQGAELEAVKARADSAIARLREIEPNWKPRPSAY